MFGVRKKFGLFFFFCDLGSSIDLVFRRVVKWENVEGKKEVLYN